ncbi:MAG: efflux RND transporter periplasmic adaptor subunit [Deltaproteobacteria bacterium]|nr:efflux RND transporter periplasmic adaptor subunit [Deltaproteobacteria bacterium]
MKSGTKKVLLVVGGLITVVAILGGIKALQIKALIDAGASFKPPPEAVTTAEVIQEEWKPTLTSVGSIVPVQGVMVSAELPGTIVEIGFDSGDTATPGQMLVRFDTSIERAGLASAVAAADLAKANLERTRALRKSNVRTQAELDAAEAVAKQADAEVQSIRATIAKKTVRAPFAGRLGIRQVDLGQFLNPGAPIVSLQSMSPIYADFWMPQQSLARVAPGQQVELKADTYPDRTWAGKVETVNAEVDASTRNVRVRAILENTDERLRPGMFVSVKVLLPEQETVLLVPATSILHAPYGDSVFLVEEKQAEGSTAQELFAKQQFVRIGERRGDFVAISSGLERGQTVVTSGGFKLRNGSRVVVENALAPNAEINPKPSES